MRELLEQIGCIAKGIWQYRWRVASLTWLLALTGWLAVYFTPDRYEASAKIYVDTETLIASANLLPRPQLEQQVVIMAKTLLTRANLERVLRAADLDIRADTETQREALISRLQRHIELKGTGREKLFTVTYSDADPHVARRVVNALVNIFTESSLRGEREKFDTTIRFLDAQIKDYENKLIAADNALKDFKRRHIGTMPEHGDDFYARLTDINNKLRQAKVELHEMQRARDTIKAQLQGEEPLVLSETEPMIMRERDQRLERLQENLDTLRLKYTEQHPDVVAVKKVMAELEAQQRERQTQHPAQPTAPRDSPLLQQLKASLVDAEARVAAMQARVEEHQAYLEELKSRLNQVPQVEADLKQLTRDYQVTQTNYERLLAERERTVLSLNANDAAGLRVSVIEPARSSDQPVSPNRPLLVSLVFLGAIGMGLLFGFALSQVRPVFFSRKALREILNLPLLGSVSLIWTPTLKRKAVLPLVGYTATVATLVLCYGLLVAFYLYLRAPLH